MTGRGQGIFDDIIWVWEKIQVEIHL